MKPYYNFTQTEFTIQYEPYLYDKKDSAAHLFLGAALFISGIIISALSIWKDGIYFGVLFGGMFLIYGLYLLLIKTKTQIEFNKKDDALYKKTPFGKTKKITLSNIYDIITVSENGCYAYGVTSKSRPGAKSIEITSFIDRKRLQKPEVQFLEQELIPLLATSFN